MSDNVNHPNHYISENGIEAIDVIEAFTKDIDDSFEAYCSGNIIEHRVRKANTKPKEDVLKKDPWDC